MYVSVQGAARELGVSPQTIRRWTSAGVLACTRTAGGHRRIRREDVRELAQLIGGSDNAAARRARERELEVLVETSVALASELELPELLKEIAHRLTALMECSYCAISTHDEAGDSVVMLADYDRDGHRLPQMRPYPLDHFPCTRAVLDEQRAILVNVSDRGGDAAEIAELISGGDKSLLMVPLVFAGRSIGLLELMDRDRERRYSPQELRLCRAIAGQAAVALHNAQMFSALREAEQPAAPLAGLCRLLPELVDPDDVESVLRAAAAAALCLPHALSCVAGAAGRSTGVSAPGVAQGPSAGGGGEEDVRLHLSTAGEDVVLATSLAGAARDVDAVFLDLVALLAAAGVRRAADAEQTTARRGPGAPAG